MPAVMIRTLMYFLTVYLRARVEARQCHYCRRGYPRAAPESFCRTWRELA